MSQIHDPFTAPSQQNLIENLTTFSSILWYNPYINKGATEMADITVLGYEIEDIGIDHSQYFTGRGITFTSWDQVQVGVGENAHEALEDALDQLAMSGYNVDHIENPFNSSMDHSEELGWAHARTCPENENYEHEHEFNGEEDFDYDQLETKCNCDYSEESELWYHVAVWIRNDDEHTEPRKGDHLNVENRYNRYVQINDGNVGDGERIFQVQDSWNISYLVYSPSFDNGIVTWFAEVDEFNEEEAELYENEVDNLVVLIGG